MVAVNLAPLDGTKSLLFPSLAQRGHNTQRHARRQNHSASQSEQRQEKAYLNRVGVAASQSRHHGLFCSTNRDRAAHYGCFRCMRRDETGREGTS